MAIAKVFGTETEYGIAAVGAPDFNPVLSSSLLISTYAGSLRRIRWDYEQESPLRDARGFEPMPAREGGDEDLGLAAGLGGEPVEPDQGRVADRLANGA